MKKPLNILIVLVFAILSICAAVLLGSIKADYEFIPQLPAGSPDRLAEEYFRGYFPAENVLILALEDGEQSAEYATEVFGLLSSLSGVHALGPELLLEPPDDGQIRGSTSNASTIRKESKTARVEALLAEDPFLASLFKPTTSSAHLLYLYNTHPEMDATLLSRIQALLPPRLTKGLWFWGLPYFRAIQEARAKADTRNLIPAAALICLLIQLLITRKLTSALSLWTVSMIPALWATALYPLSGTAFKVESILVPVQIIALSTSYAIQYYRYSTLHPTLPAEARLKGIRPVILLAGTTTILGFLSLFAIPIPAIKAMAGFMVLGISIAMATALILLPILLGKLLESGAKLPAPSPRLGTFGKGPALPVVLALLVAVGATGLVKISSGAMANDSFRPWDEYTQASDFMNDHFGGLDEIELIIDGGEDYFFIDPEHFATLETLAAGIRHLSWVSMVLDPTSFLTWSFRRINGQNRAPTTIDEIGETVEVSSGSMPGLSIRSLLADDSRFARILIRGSMPDPYTFKAATMDILAQAEEAFPEGKHHLTGNRIQHQAFESYLVNGLIQGLAWFLPTLFIFLLLYFRSPFPALHAMIPPTTALLVYFGLAGWFGIRINTVVTVGAAIVMGVGVDDVLHLLLTVQAALKTGSDRRTSCIMALATSGKSIIQTTVVIIAGLAVLGFSGFTAVAQTGLLASAGLVVATLTTLILVPYLIAGKHVI